MTHERETLEALVAARERAAANHGEHDSQIADEHRLDQWMGSFLARAAAYPDLKANEHFLALQHQLTMTEDRIAAIATVAQPQRPRLEHPGSDDPVAADAAGTLGQGALLRGRRLAGPPPAGVKFGPARGSVGRDRPHPAPDRGFT